MMTTARQLPLPELAEDTGITITEGGNEHDGVMVSFPVRQYPITLVIISLFFGLFLFRLGWMIGDKALFMLTDASNVVDGLLLVVMIVLWGFALTFFIKFFRLPRSETWQLTPDNLQHWSAADGVNLFESNDLHDGQNMAFFPTSRHSVILLTDIRDFELRNSERGARIVVVTRSGNNIEMAKHASDVARQALLAYLRRYLSIAKRHQSTDVG